jgi:hypothetical protein
MAEICPLARRANVDKNSSNRGTLTLAVSIKAMRKKTISGKAMRKKTISGKAMQMKTISRFLCFASFESI